VRVPRGSACESGSGRPPERGRTPPSAACEERSAHLPSVIAWSNSQYLWLSISSGVVAGVRNGLAATGPWLVDPSPAIPLLCAVLPDAPARGVEHEIKQTPELLASSRDRGGRDHADNGCHHILGPQVRPKGSVGRAGLQ